MRTNKNSIFLFVLIGILILWYYIYLLRLRTFYTWPDTFKQTKEFWNVKKDLFSLKYDTLATLNESYAINDRNISKIWKGFNKSLLWLSIYFILILLYLLIITYYV